MRQPKRQINYKSRLYSQFAQTAHALANSRRLEIIDLLGQGERSVEDLAREIGTTISNISQHLQVLRVAGLVASRKEGVFVYYQLSSEEAATLWRALRSTSVRLSSDLRELVAQFVENRDTFEPVAHDELLTRARTGAVTVIDVRPTREYRAGHIPGALSIPLEELEDRLGELPRDREVVAYCRGPYCLLSVEAVERLRELGYSSRRMLDGFPEWQAAGRPVQSD